MQPDERAAPLEYPAKVSRRLTSASTGALQRSLTIIFRWLLAVPRWLVRFYRRRLSAQLIASHVAVVLLTAGLIAVLLVIAIGNSAGPFGNSTPLIDQLSSTSALLAGQAAGQFPALQRGPSDPNYQLLQRNIQSLAAVSQPAPGEPAQSGSIERVLVVSAAGTILAGSGSGVVRGNPATSLEGVSSVFTKA